MECLSSSTKDTSNIEEESEIAKCIREDIERKERQDKLDNAEREYDLFNMYNVSRESEEEESREVSLDERSAVSTLHLPGIEFFNGRLNCDYDQNSIKAELSEFKHCSELDLQSLIELKDKILYEYLIENSTHKEQPFRTLMKLLFTSQSPEYLKVTSDILILYLKKLSQVSTFVDIIISTLPIGLKNIGGDVSKLFSEENLRDDSVCEVDKPENIKSFSLVENIRYMVDVLQYSLRKAKLQSKGMLILPDPIIDNLIFTLITVSQDPQILGSNILSSIKNCLAEILDIYPSDCIYPKKVQDIVERIIIYWQDSSEDFDHIVAYRLCLDVIPQSRRGKQLRASIAYSSLIFCLPSVNLDILDRVSMYQLSKFCRENVNEFSQLDCKTLFSVINLIDAAIPRPVHVDNDVEHVNSLLTTITKISSEKSNPLLKDELFHKIEFDPLVREITTQWNKLIDRTSKSAKMGENLY